MMRAEIIIIWTTLFTACRCESDLIAVTALIRHGARLPESLYPNDPNTNFSWPYVMGDLTNVGIREMADVGKWLKKNYKNFLSKKYDPNEIYVQSNSYDRCMMSGEATLAGLYPPISDQVWNKRINWQPIPIHTSPLTQDIILNMNLCPKMGEESAVIRNTTFYQNIMTEYNNYFAYISKHSGEQVDFSTMYPLFDTLFTEIKLQLPQPMWVRKIYPQMLPLIVQYTKMDSMLKIEQRIQSGPILLRILEQFDKAIKGVDFGTTKTIYRKFMAYFATEWILYDLTYTLDLPAINIPDFGASYLIELRKRKENGEYFVNILYRHSTSLSTKAVPAPIRNLNFDLDYGNFTKIVEPYLVDTSQWVNLCQNFTNNKTLNILTNVPST